MNRTQSLIPNISTKLQRIADKAAEDPQCAFTSLAHLLDTELLHRAYRLTRKSGAAGIDGQTARGYEANLWENLGNLHKRLKSGQYRAPPVRRVHIPKGTSGATRPIGIPTFEDKVVQRAVAMILERIYEQDFLPCSHGFRPGRSPLGAAQAVWDAIMGMRGGTVVELDIQKFFDTLDHQQLRSFIGLRVRDGALLRLIGKWLNAGVMEAGAVTYAELGTPQGGVISPILANVYLHHVLDLWFEREVRPRLRGKAELVRYADDAVIVCQRPDDALRLMAVLPKRFERFGLKLHPSKTRTVSFQRPPLWPQKPARTAPPAVEPESFNFLGFTYYWGRSQRGFWVVHRKTAKDRLVRAVSNIRDWCMSHRHAPLAQQHQTLTQKLQGHYGYYGITGNGRALTRLWWLATRAWHAALGRRSRAARRSWNWFLQVLQRYPLPNPHIVHRATW